MPHIKKMYEIIDETNKRLEEQMLKEQEEERASIDFDARRISEQD